MGDKEDNKSKISTSDMDNLSLDINGHSRDLLTRFMGWREGKDEGYNKEDDDEEKIELNLGLSLGGQFGVDKCSNKLLRASSIAECLPFVKDVDDALTVSSPSVSYSRLSRTTSLPIETEEWRKRKELQTLRRMEAKRRRSEKQRNLRAEKEGVPSSEKDLNLRNRLEKDKLLAAAIQIDSRVVVVPPPPPLGSSTSAIKGQLEVGGVANKGKKIHEFGHLLSQKSVEYQGGSSSSSEFDNRFSLQGSCSCEDASQSLQESNNKNISSSGMKSVFKTSLLKAENLQKHSDTVRNQLKRKEALTIASEEMPGVFTKGDGPNGRRVDGILYKFGRGEEVRIMCVCHGSFHSPAGFVKHAGGTDISHPLKHIVMNPNLIPLT